MAQARNALSRRLKTHKPLLATLAKLAKRTKPITTPPHCKPFLTHFINSLRPSIKLLTILLLLSFITQTHAHKPLTIHGSNTI
jgi:hypothetical protein